MEKKMKVQMEGTLESQSLARAVAGAYAAEMDPTVDELTEIKTAVSEAVSNVALHAYPGDLTGDMILEFMMPAPDTILIRVTDRGVGIEDIAKAMEPMYTTDTGENCSGMGFTVMESFMDRIRVDSRPGEGTTVTMIKRLDTYCGF
ncbi:MAG: anti-sigma F factor [Firmicutes bacterium]|nr:anti-sigma F factor [Bacillota bacterium]